MRHALLLVILLLLIPTAYAQEETADGVPLIYDVWADPLLPAGQVGLYLTIENPTADDIVLTGMHGDHFSGAVILQGGQRVQSLEIPAGARLSVDGADVAILLKDVVLTMEIDDVMPLTLVLALPDGEQIEFPYAAVMRSTPPEASTLVVANARARPTALEQDVDAVDAADVISGAYMVIENRGDNPVQLVDARAFEIGSVQFHETEIDNDIMRMSLVMEFEILPGERLTLEPGGAHLMLTELEEHLIPGRALMLTLDFETEQVQVGVPIRDESVAPEHQH